jgi:hypothetical protein
MGMVLSGIAAAKETARKYETGGSKQAADVFALS